MTQFKILLSVHYRMDEEFIHLELQNTVMLAIDFERIVNTNFDNEDEELLNQFITHIPAFEERSLNELFRNTCKRVCFGYTWYQKVLRLSGKKTFLPAMRNYEPYQMLSVRKQKELQKQTTYATKIYQDWNRIVANCTNPLMENIDVRRFSMYQLYRARSFTWVDDLNSKHSETRPPPIVREYPLYMVDNILENVEGSTNLLLNYVNRNIDQLKLVGMDITNALIRRANGTL